MKWELNVENVWITKSKENYKLNLNYSYLID